VRVAADRWGAVILVVGMAVVALLILMLLLRT
jgi:hypothetical protein